MLPLIDRSRTEILIIDENKRQPISEQRKNKFLDAIKTMRPIEFFGVNYLVCRFEVYNCIGNPDQWVYEFDLKETSVA